MLSMRNEYTRATEIEEAAEELIKWLEENVTEFMDAGERYATAEAWQLINSLKEALIPLNEDPAQIPEHDRKVAYDNGG